MREHVFDEMAVQRWRQLADHASHELSHWKAVSDPATEAANQASLVLKQAIAETVGKIVAEWAYTRWRITLEPIEQCVRIELDEQRPWPSEAAKRRRRLAAEAARAERQAQ